MFGINIQHDNDKTFNSKGSDFWVKKVYHDTEFLVLQKESLQKPQKK